MPRGFFSITSNIQSCISKKKQLTQRLDLNLALNQEHERAEQRDSEASNETGESAGESAHYPHFLYHKHIRELGYQSCVYIYAQLAN